MPRNPPWTRDELILALDLFFRVNPLHTSKTNPDIVALSKTLNKLPAQGRIADASRYRNPNGVYMKLCNFLRLDPSYHGKGLTGGGKLEEVIWKEFEGDQDRLGKTAEAIKAGATEIKSGDPDIAVIATEEGEFAEGRILTILHKRRERHPDAVRKKKAMVMKEKGRLACEVCGFDFAVMYGSLGNGFAECHHTIPLPEMKTGHKTKPEDFAIVCANYHRMIHRSKPMLSVDGMREAMKKFNQ